MQKKFLTSLLVAFALGVICTSCSSKNSNDNCIGFVEIVELMQKKLLSAKHGSQKKFNEIVHSESEEIKQIAFENFSTLYNLCRAIDDRVGEDTFDSKTMDSNQTFNGVKLINRLFRDDWQIEENNIVSFDVHDDYAGVVVYFNNIMSHFLVIRVDDQIKFDLDSHFVDTKAALQWYRTLGAKSTKRNVELLETIINKDAQSWDEFTEVMRMKDWTVRLNSKQ